MKIIRSASFFAALALVFACSPDVEPMPGPQPDQPKEEDPDKPDSPDPNLSADCDLVTFALSASKNALPSSIAFTLDKAVNKFSAKYLKWIDGETPDMFIPTIVTTGVKVETADGTEVTSGVTAVSLAKPLQLVVYAENGDTKTYTVDFNCPQINTEVPCLRIGVKASAITSKDVYVQTTAKLTSPLTKEGWYDGDIEIRGRGNSTWGLPKKPYRIKFPDKISPVGLNHAKAKSWVLLANDMDKSLIRDALGWEMSRILFNKNEGYHDPNALTFTPCVQYVNVYMLNDYHGLYLMSDHMERAKGRIEVDKLEAADGSDSEIIKGGHIIEVNIHGESAPKRFRTNRGVQMDHKYPEDDNFDPAQYAYIENYIKQAESAIYSTGYKNPTTGWRKYIDEKTLADYIIIKELCGDMDGYTSTYFYKMRASDKLFWGPIWDVDKGWDNDRRTAGSTADKANNLMIHAGFQMPGCSGSDWYNRIWTDETFRAFVNARWKAKRAELVTAVKNAAKNLPASMPKAIDCNYTVWKFYYQASTEANMPAATYEQEIQRIINLTDQRAAVLDKLFAK